MAVSTPTTPGQILTSAYVNNNINSGLTYVSTTSITASGQNIANAFSSTYTNYLILCTDMVTSANNAGFGFRLGSSTTRTEYQYGGTNITLSSGAISADYNNAANYALCGYTKGAGGGNMNYAITLLNPQQATKKTWSSNWANGQYNGQTTGLDALASAQTDINFMVSTGTLTGGTVTIYGYRKA